MSRHAVTVLPAGVTFTCARDETVLEAALRNGFALPYGCRKGNCGTCKAQILDGAVDDEDSTRQGLTDFERQQGYTLLCSAYADGDLTVEMEDLDASELTGAGAVEDYKAVINAIDVLTHDIRSVQVELDRPMPFRAGQFAELGIADTGIVRALDVELGHRGDHAAVPGQTRARRGVLRPPDRPARR
jgi:propane monooxygenase reductase subunit